MKNTALSILLWWATRCAPLAALLIVHCSSWISAQEIPSSKNGLAKNFSGAKLKLVDQFTLKGEKHLIHDYSPRTQGEGVRVVVEIPAGTGAKWEVDKGDGSLKWEFKNGKPRIVKYLPYPGNYGMVPRTLLAAEEGGDGDPLDVLILGPSLPRGSIAEVRLIGVLKLLDGGEKDDKLLAVLPNTPLGKAAGLEDLRRNFPGVLEIVVTWMTNYKGPGEIVSKGFGDRLQAKRILDSAIETYRTARPKVLAPAGFGPLAGVGSQDD